MKWFIRGYAVVLLLYTGWRTYDFIQSSLPHSDISFWLSIAFLFATEAGLVLWHEANLNHTTTQTQEWITKTMTWIDFVGSLSAGIADMILRQTFIEGYTVPPSLAQFLIYGLPVIMAANVAAVVLYEQEDAQTQEDKAEKSMRFEVHREAMRQIKADRASMAAEKSDMIYRKVRGRVVKHVDNVYSATPPAKPAVPTPSPSPIETPKKRSVKAMRWPRQWMNAEAPIAKKTTEAKGSATTGDNATSKIINPTRRRGK